MSKLKTKDLDTLKSVIEYYENVVKPAFACSTSEEEEIVKKEILNGGLAVRIAQALMDSAVVNQKLVADILTPLYELHDSKTNRYTRVIKDDNLIKHIKRDADGNIIYYKTEIDHDSDESTES